MEERIQKVKQQVKELMEWRDKNFVQQIPFNPPINTTTIMQDGMLVATGVTKTGVTFDISLEVDFGGLKLLIPAKLNQ